MSKRMFALVDCNNFFVSCERLFRPDLRYRPVLVLSNNDGCVVSRSNEVKKLGIKMGEPYFKIEHLVRAHNIAVFSSNFQLYLDISRRVKETLAHYSNRLENYSVDEAFLDLSHMDDNINLWSYGGKIKYETSRYTGIPVCVGIAPTKTLAKVANYGAKHDFLLGGVYIVDNEQDRIKLLERTPIEEVWGIGKQYAQRLKNDLYIENALEFANFNPEVIRSKYNIVLARIVNELNGVSCLELEDIPEPKKQMMRSKTFGEKVTDINVLYQILATFTADLAQNLRAEKQYTYSIGIFIRTNPFTLSDIQYSNSLSFTFHKPVNDTKDLLDAVGILLTKIFRKNIKYHKAGVFVDMLTQDASYQADLFMDDEVDEEKKLKRQKLMNLIDSINAKKPHSIFVAAQGAPHKSISSQNKLSPLYTTKWSDVPKVF